MDMKKKLLAIFMILAMSFCLFACGDDETQNSDGDLQTEDGVEIDLSEDEGESDTPEYIFPEVNDDESYDDGESYDFGMKVKKSFGMASTLKKIDYGKISTAGDELQSKLESALAKENMSDFVIAFNDYEEDDEADIDKLAYVAALEDDDMDKAIVELGAYHDDSTGKYYQYNGYTSETLTSADDSVKDILSEIESAYGIKLSESKIKKALKKAWSEAESIEDYYGFYQRSEFSGDGYTDNVVVRVDALCDEDGSMGAYIYAERERLYA